MSWPPFCGLLPLTWPLACVCGQPSGWPVRQQPFREVPCCGVWGFSGPGPVLGGVSGWHRTHFNPSPSPSWGFQALGPSSD